MERFTYLYIRVIFLLILSWSAGLLCNSYFRYTQISGTAYRLCYTRHTDSAQYRYQAISQGLFSLLPENSVPFIFSIFFL